MSDSTNQANSGHSNSGQNSLGQANSGQANSGQDSLGQDIVTVAAARSVVDEEAEENLELNLANFAGPLDLLLELVRKGKTDLSAVSMSMLADQYLAFITQLNSKKFVIAFEYLLLASLLILMKSRLLLHADSEDEAELDELLIAEQLKQRLLHLQLLKDNIEKLMARPRLGEQVFLRGYCYEQDQELLAPKIAPVIEYVSLLEAYTRLYSKTAGSPLIIADDKFYTVESATRHLRANFFRLQDWQSLFSILPELQQAVDTRSIIAATFVASLELVKLQELEIKQEDADIRIRRINYQAA